MNDFTPLSALAGGALIGLAATLFLLSHGRVAGISGIVAGTILRDLDGDARRARGLFLIGLLAAGVMWRIVDPDVFGAPRAATASMLTAAVIGGAVVGFGTRLGGGCTSGHGVCGLSRLSVRSAVATAIFMSVAVATVYVTRHVVSWP